MPGSTAMPRFSIATDSDTAVYPASSCHRRDNTSLAGCALLSQDRLLKTERVGDAGGSGGGVGARAAGWLGGKQHYVTLHPAPLFPLPPNALILQRATGQVSRHWLHVLHLGCLAFFSSPKWSSEFHVAGRVTGPGDGSQQMGEIRRGPGTSEAHNGLPRTRRRHTGPASCHLPFGMINPQRTGDSFVGPSLFNC